MMKSRYLALWLMGSAGVLLSVLLWLGLEHRKEVGKGESSGEKSGEQFIALGQILPSFRIENLYKKGEWITEKTLLGKTFGINFFASWCVPCRAEHPLLAKLNIPLIGIAWKDKDKDIVHFIDELGMIYAGVGTDPDGTTMIDYGIEGIPETLIVDEEGRIIYHRQGVITSRILAKKIQPLLDSIKNE